MKKLAIVLGFVILGLILLIIFVPAKSKSTSSQADPNKISVTASFYPLAEFAREVGKNAVDVKTITPPGAEPHDYEPSPQDIIRIRTSKVFIYNGNGVDAWADKIAPQLKTLGIIVIKMSDGITGSDADPHFWLDPVQAQSMVKTISEAMIKADAAHEEDYLKNANQYISQLQELDNQFKTGVASCSLNQIVVSHNAFSYLAKRYGFSTYYISGLSPEEEPSIKRLSEIAQVAKDMQIQYIFFESLVNPKLSQTVASEIGAKTLVLNPLEGLTDDQVKSGKNYISVMRENLTNLRIAMECE